MRSNIDERKQQVMQVLHDRKGMKTRQKHIAEQLVLSQQFISMVLAQLMKEGRVIRARNMGYQEAPDESV
jgi:DNA-binding MarR family transcriptional regulator